VIEHKQKQPF
ncbi:hypothetical protein VC87395_003475B, partial [Vibrio paracholerae 87395]